MCVHSSEPLDLVVLTQGQPVLPRGSSLNLWGTRVQPLDLISLPYSWKMCLNLPAFAPVPLRYQFIWPLTGTPYSGILRGLYNILPVISAVGRCNLLPQAFSDIYPCSLCLTVCLSFLTCDLVTLVFSLPPTAATHCHTDLLTPPTMA